MTGGVAVAVGSGVALGVGEEGGRVGVGEGDGACVESEDGTTIGAMQPARVMSSTQKLTREQRTFLAPFTPGTNKRAPRDAIPAD